MRLTWYVVGKATVKGDLALVPVTEPRRAPDGSVEPGSYHAVARQNGPLWSVDPDATVRNSSLASFPLGAPRLERTVRGSPGSGAGLPGGPGPARALGRGMYRPTR